MDMKGAFGGSDFSSDEDLETTLMTQPVWEGAEQSNYDERWLIIKLCWYVLDNKKMYSTKCAVEVILVVVWTVWAGITIITWLFAIQLSRPVCLDGLSLKKDDKYCFESIAFFAHSDLFVFFSETVPQVDGAGDSDDENNQVRIGRPS